MVAWQVLGMSDIIPATSLPSIRRGKKFKRLSMIHRKVVALHLSGVTNLEIDSALNMHSGFASNVLRSDKSKRVLEIAYQDFDAELKALTPKAIDAFRRNMDCGDPAVEVRAAREVLMANGKYDESQDRRMTAEDVIERVMERISPDGTRTRYAEKRVLGADRGVHNWNAPMDD
jgi:hypothetical protein